MARAIESKFLPLMRGCRFEAYSPQRKLGVEWSDNGFSPPPSGGLDHTSIFSNPRLAPGAN